MTFGWRGWLSLAALFAVLAVAVGPATALAERNLRETHRCPAVPSGES
jgi:hypothetical protein